MISARGLSGWALVLAVAACGGGDKPQAGGASAAKKIEITPTKDARADAKTYLAQLCPKPIGGELNFMVWEGYTDTLFTRPFEDACGVKVNATYMGSSDDLVAKLRAGGAETIDLISPSSDAATAIIEAGLAAPLDLGRIPSYNDLSEGFRNLKVARKGDAVYGEPWAFGPNPLIYDSSKVRSAPDSWGALWDKKYRSKLSLQDDIATLYMVAQYLGMDDSKDPSHLYNLSDADLAKVKAKMLELRPNVRKYWVTAGDMTQLFQSGEVVMGEGWPLMTNQLRQAKFPAAE
ncbi:MAG: spermidine/putrescine transport system substrate-binding protein, partial [Gemmatimonadales bacterium]|nr:spermidine/putrescine transport system substrate-binding protein [Gemmatimonadales bacterium]